MPALVVAALFAGLAASNRRAYIASISARAQDEARRRVDEERLRIARELHDVVAHTMATINVQAGVAGHVLKDRPEAAGEALRIIRTASKDGLRELRAILNVLRQADEADPTQPAPGLGQVDALIASASQAGLATSLRRTGVPRPLPSEVDVAAYRIIQESLTNAIRHAGPAAATVWPGLRRGRAAGGGRGHRPGRWPWPRRGPPPATGSSACGNGPPRWAGPWRPGRARTAASGSRPASRPRPRRERADPADRANARERRPGRRTSSTARRRDPGAAGRRPGADPGRLPGAAGLGRRPGGGGRGGGRRRGGRTGPPPSEPTWC